MSDYYSDSNIPINGQALDATVIKAEFDLISGGFAKIAPYTGNGGKIVAINAGGTAQEAVASTGTGNVVRATNPVLVTPNIGTPSAGVLTNCTGTAAGLSIGGNAATSTLAANATQAANAAKIDNTTTVLASATTVNLGASTTFNNAISGSTPVEGFDTVAEGVLRKVTCTGAVPFVYSANLLLIGGVDRTCSIGDVMLWRSEGSGVWAEEIFQPVAGYPLNHGARQIVLTGPYDSSGNSNYLPASASGLNLTSQNISASAPLIVSSFNGFNTAGPVDIIGKTESNLTWTGLTNNTENYLYVTIAAGVLTAGFTTLAPVIQPSGTPSVTAGQITVNTVDAKVYLGNGTTAPQTNLVVVGRATTSGGNVTNTSSSYYAGQGTSVITSILATNSAWRPNVATKKFRVRDCVGGGSSGCGATSAATGRKSCGKKGNIVQSLWITSIGATSYAATIGAGGVGSAGGASVAGNNSSFIGAPVYVLAEGGVSAGAVNDTSRIADSDIAADSNYLTPAVWPGTWTNGNPATGNTGSAGTGAYGQSGGANWAGGAGGSGRIDIEEYI